MPTYTYRCTKCDAEIEVVQSMSDPPLKRCKRCRGALRRTFHPVGIVLKGSGFHRNDYRSKPSKSTSDSSDKSDKKDTSSSSSAAKTSESKSPSGSDKKDTGSKSSGSTTSD